MEIPRQNPDQLLRAIRNDTESKKKRGKLKIFFGYAAGVGKTYAMLQAAHQAKAKWNRGGCRIYRTSFQTADIGSLGWPRTAPCKAGALWEMILREFDIDSALKRKPN